jgi:IS1 family transposase
MDELFTFVGAKKKPVYIVMLVERESRRVVAHEVCWERTPEVMQRVIDSAPHAASYYSDVFNTYRELCWWGEHTSMYDISDLLG